MTRIDTDNFAIKILALFRFWVDHFYHNIFNAENAKKSERNAKKDDFQHFFAPFALSALKKEPVKSVNPESDKSQI